MHKFLPHNATALTTAVMLDHRKRAVMKLYARSVISWLYRTWIRMTISIILCMALSWRIMEAWRWESVETRVSYFATAVTKSDAEVFI